MPHTPAGEPRKDDDIELSVVICAWNEAANLSKLLPALHAEVSRQVAKYEIIVVDGGSKDASAEVARAAGAHVISQTQVGYGGAAREGFERARGRYVLTLDADCSHPPALFSALWAQRKYAEIVVASRFVENGASDAPPFRRFLSSILNSIFLRLLRVPIRDSSSGFRLYLRQILKPPEYHSNNFSILQEILVQAISDGYSIKEIPFHYADREEGSSHASVLKFASSYLMTIHKLWILRHSPHAADYEANAYNSRHLLQRWWQRRRVAILDEFTAGCEAIVDVGCGSGKFITSHPEAIALDSQQRKLRFLRRTHRKRICAEFPRLPFRNESLSCVVLSQLLPYVENAPRCFEELRRVIKVGGRVIIGVPDSSRLRWKLVGFLYHLLPNVARNKQITSFARESLCAGIVEQGFAYVQSKYVCGSELIALFERVE